MELTHLKLRPGEEIRTPLVLLLGWQGSDFLDGQNLLRRFLLAHHMPHQDGRPVTLTTPGPEPPLARHEASFGSRVSSVSES